MFSIIEFRRKIVTFLYVFEISELNKNYFKSRENIFVRISETETKDFLEYITQRKNIYR